MEFLWFIVGCILLWFGGNGVVDGASGIARKFHLSELVIGLSLVAIGTSLPEVFVNIIASLNNEPDLVIGNVIGSNISNSCLILGAAGVLSPLIIPTCRMRREIQFYFLCILVLLGIVYIFGTINAGSGTALFGLFIVAMFLFFVPKPQNGQHSAPTSNPPLWKSLFLLLGGCALLPLGGHYLITSAISIAQGLGLSKAFISLFAVALGTSLPELVTSIIAAKRGNTELALGNVLGSNIFNITLVLGISSWIAPITINSIYIQDMFIMILCSLPLAAILLKTSKIRLSSFFSYSMLAVYGIYCGFIYFR